MSENIVIKENLIQDFIDSTSEVLSTMAAIDVEPKGYREVRSDTNNAGTTVCMDITGVIGFSGGRQGSILVTLSEQIAMSAVGGMLGTALEEMDADVTDGVGELVNMIAGGAKTKIQQKGFDFELSIPNTIMGANHQITGPAASSRTRLDFGTPAGDFFVEVHLKQE